MTNRMAISKIEGKTKHYHNDGTGRDSYISRFNGGQLSDRLINAIKPEQVPVYEKMNFLTASNKNLSRATAKNLPPQLPIKTAKYWGDGSGRDYFVIHNDGGQSIPYNWQDNPAISYLISLRTYPKTQNIQRVQSACSTRYDKLAEPKKQVPIQERPHTPNIKNANKVYKSYQTLKYQSKARNLKLRTKTEINPQ